MRIQFVDEHGIEEAGIDGGGLFKDFMEYLVREVPTLAVLYMLFLDIGVGYKVGYMGIGYMDIGYRVSKVKVIYFFDMLKSTIAVQQQCCEDTESCCTQYQQLTEVSEYVIGWQDHSDGSHVC